LLSLIFCIRFSSIFNWLFQFLRHRFLYNRLSRQLLFSFFYKLFELIFLN
jgi:hypothetical protein